MDFHPSNRKVLLMLDLLEAMLDIEVVSEDLLEIETILEEELPNV